MYITSTLASPTTEQYFIADQPLLLTEIYTGSSPPSIQLTPTLISSSVSSTTVIFDQPQTGLGYSADTLSGFDYNVYFYTVAEDYSDLAVSVDPLAGTNRLIEFAQSTLGGYPRSTAVTATECT